MPKSTQSASITTALAILQQSEYDHAEFSRWWEKHATSDSVPEIKPEKWTPKLKLINQIASVLPFLPIPTRLKVATSIVGIPEYGVKKYTVTKAVKKLRAAQKKGLIVVAIAGSYGKTSTKHWLYHLLKNQTAILSTQKSINTPLGIAQTIENELTNQHEIFIVELGEYYQGDIAELANLIQPDFGILTPVGRQHLFRMKSINTIADTIGELLTYFEQKHSKNASLLPIISAAENKPYFGERVSYYGVSHRGERFTWTITDATVSRAGTEVQLESPTQESFSFFTPLYGSHQCSNALPAFWLASQLNDKRGKISLNKLAQAAATMPYIYQRHEPHFAANDVLILDNSYNTNPESFDASLKLLSDLKPTRKIVITLGFVELGEESTTIHTELGKKLATATDYLGIIESDEAATIKESYLRYGGDPENVVIAKTPESCMTALQSHVIPGTIILFEGGYREVLV